MCPLHGQLNDFMKDFSRRLSVPLARPDDVLEGVFWNSSDQNVASHVAETTEKLYVALRLPSVAKEFWVHSADHATFTADTVRSTMEDGIPKLQDRINSVKSACWKHLKHVGLAGLRFSRPRERGRQLFKG
eukprot:scaffold3612_cov215-Pinguiococcus_pyrenoidosus.AAC.1